MSNIEIKGIIYEVNGHKYTHSEYYSMLNKELNNYKKLFANNPKVTKSDLDKMAWYHMHKIQKIAKITFK